MFYRIAAFLVSIGVKIFYRFRVEGLPELNKDKRLILCANHFSMRDILAIASAFPGTLHFVAKKELGKGRLLSWFFSKLGVIFIDREANDIEAMRKILAKLKEEKMICIFPEGTRVKEVSPSNMKSGVALIAMRGKSDVLCATIVTEYRFRKELLVRFHPPIHHEDYLASGAKQGRAELTRDIFNTIYSTEYKLEDFEG